MLAVDGWALEEEVVLFASPVIATAGPVGGFGELEGFMKDDRIGILTIGAELEPLVVARLILLAVEAESGAGSAVGVGDGYADLDEREVARFRRVHGAHDGAAQVFGMRGRVERQAAHRLRVAARHVQPGHGHVTVRRPFSRLLSHPAELALHHADRKVHDRERRLLVPTDHFTIVVVRVESIID